MVTARVLGLLCAIVLSAGCAVAAREAAGPGPGEPAVTIWVVDHGWHTSIVVRRDDVLPGAWPETADFPEAALIEVAWGDREFYMTPSPSTWMAIRAAIAGNPGVLHVVGLGEPAAVVFSGSEVVALRLSRPGFDAVIRFIADEFERDAGGRSSRLQRGLYGESWFYAARSTYRLSNTCNTWVAGALRAGGLPITPDGVITAGGLMEQARAAARAP